MARGLGDSHNFGRRVSARGGVIVKPRALLWEWLTLDPASPLRRCLEDAGARDGLGGDAFAFLPSLRVDVERGEVERLELSPLPAPPSDAARRALAVIVGRSLALWSWLGVADLHWENLALGLDASGRVVFGPLDVEMILADFSRPTETKLIPDADPEVAEVCRHAAGVRRALPYLGKPARAEDVVAMAAAYLPVLALLDRRARALADVLSSVPGLRETPIRVCLRGTGDYLAAPAEVWPPLLDAEAAQLDRGDIPYFFRLLGRPGIHFYADAELERVGTLPTHGDVPQLEPLLSLPRGLRSPGRARLREEGLFTLLGAFDHPSFRGRVEAEGVSVAFQGRTLVVEAGGDELASRRDLRAFVGSVYLPCRCGEVLSPLVPRVTRCEA